MVAESLLLRLKSRGLDIKESLVEDFDDQGSIGLDFFSEINGVGAGSGGQYGGSNDLW